MRLVAVASQTAVLANGVHRTAVTQVWKKLLSAIFLKVERAPSRFPFQPGWKEDILVLQAMWPDCHLIVPFFHCTCLMIFVRQVSAGAHPRFLPSGFLSSLISTFFLSSLPLLLKELLLHPIVVLLSESDWLLLPPPPPLLSAFLLGCLALFTFFFTLLEEWNVFFRPLCFALWIAVLHLNALGKVYLFILSLLRIYNAVYCRPGLSSKASA